MGETGSHAQDPKPRWSQAREHHRLREHAHREGVHGDREEVQREDVSSFPPETHHQERGREEDRAHPGQREGASRQDHPEISIHGEAQARVDLSPAIFAKTESDRAVMEIHARMDNP